MWTPLLTWYARQAYHAHKLFSETTSNRGTHSFEREFVLTIEKSGHGGPERRQHARYDRTLRFTSTTDNGFPVLETLNISAGGCLCRVDRYVKPMTRFAISGAIPGSETPLKADAVVVRVIPGEEIEGQSDYQVALFFQKMGESSRDALRCWLEG